MKKEDFSVLAQVLTAIKDNISKIEEAQKRKDKEMLATAKREILTLQQQIDNML